MTPAIPTIPDHARCRKCDYQLRGLTTCRCPECGQEFDPADSRSMNLGAPIHPTLRAICSVPGNPWRRWWEFSILVIAWGNAWLLGAYLVETIGWLSLAIFWAASMLRLLAYTASVCKCRRRWEWPILPGFRACIFSGLLFSAIAGITRWAAVRVQEPLAKDYAWKLYAQTPVIDLTPDARWCGLTYMERVDVGPSGVVMHVWMGGSIKFVESEEGRMRATLPEFPFDTILHEMRELLLR